MLRIEGCRGISTDQRIIVRLRRPATGDDDLPVVYDSDASHLAADIPLVSLMPDIVMPDGEDDGEANCGVELCAFIVCASNGSDDEMETKGIVLLSADVFDGVGGSSGTGKESGWRDLKEITTQDHKIGLTVRFLSSVNKTQQQQQQQ
eukprot:PhM_4_TR4589/c1_g1_i1/m.98993